MAFRSIEDSILLAETHLSSLKSFWWQQIIQFWNSLASAPNSSVHKTVLLESISGTKTFSFSIFRCLKSIGISTPVQLPAIPVIDLNLDHEAFSPWNNLSCDPRSAPSTNAKLCTYSNWFQFLPPTPRPIFYYQCQAKVFTLSSQFSCFAYRNW